MQFARLYPLGQRDLPIERKHVDFGPLMPASARIENPSRDYTPPSKSLFACWAVHTCNTVAQCQGHESSVIEEMGVMVCRVYLAALHRFGRADARCCFG